MYQERIANYVTTIDVTRRVEAEQKLLEAEEKYRGFFEVTPFSIVLLDLDGNFVDCNPARFSILGITKEELIGTNINELNLFPLKFQPIVNKAFITILKEKKVEPIIIQSYNRDGNLIWVQLQGSLIHLGEKTLVQVIVQDINEKKLTEEEVKYQAELIENVSDAIISTDIDFNIISWNKAAKSIYGWKANETIGKNIMDIIPMEYSDDDEESVVKQFFEEGFWKGEVIQPRKDGTLLNILASVSIIKDDEYNPIGTVAINRDITERKREEQKLKAEEKIKEQNAFLTNVIEALTHPFYIINVNDYTIEMANSAANFGDLSGEEKCFILTHQNDKPCSGEHPCPITMVKSTKSPVSVEHIHYDEKGNPRNFDIHGYPIFDENGEVIQMIEYAIDITEHRKAEQKLEQSEYNLKERVKELKCLYGISKLAENFDISKHEFILGTLNLIPPAMQYPDITCARIKFDDKEFKTDNYRNTEWKLSSKILINGKDCTLEILYLEEKPFLDEEASLIKEIINRLKNIIEKQEAEQKIKESEEKYRNLSTELEKKVIERTKKLKDSEEKYRDLFNFMSNGVAVYEAVNDGEDFRFKDFNLAGEKIDNIKKEELLGKSVIEKFPSVKEFGIFNVLQRVWKTGKPESLPVSQYKDDKVTSWRENYVYKLPSGEIVAVYDDVTTQKIAEQKLKESKEKYREAYNRGNFYKDLFAHDINNIMQVINSSTELISYQFDETEKSKNIEELTIMIKKQITRAKKLVQNVILLSDLEEIHQSIKLTETCDLLRNSINFMYNSFPEREINLQIESLNKTIFVQANELLQDVFENILTNAVKYNEKNTVELEIKISKAHKEGKNYLKIEFRDNGIGIADDRKAIIFEKGHRNLKGLKGMGLGLSLVKKILTIYDCKIWVEDRVRGDRNQGSNFILLIPQ